jgi:hypothetical protein
LAEHPERRTNCKETTVRVVNIDPRSGEEFLGNAKAERFFSD